MDHRASFQGNEITRCASVFDGLDCCNLEWKLHESTFGIGFVEQSPSEQKLASRGARISSHLHNDHGTGAGRCVDCCCGSDDGERERAHHPTHTVIPKHTPPPTQRKHDVFTVMKKDTQATCEYPNRCQKLVFVLKFVNFLVSGNDYRCKNFLVADT